MPEATKGTPVISEQDKAEPQLVSAQVPIDRKQRAASISIDFTSGEATITVQEGEDIGRGFVPRLHPQRAVDLDDVAAVIANKSKTAVIKALADFCLAKGTEPVAEESP